MRLYEKAHKVISHKFRGVPKMKNCSFMTMSMDRIVVIQWKRDGDTLACMYMPETGNVSGPYVP